MSRVNIDDYMLAVQETALRDINHSKLRNEQVMFRAVDVPFLTPRLRVEMGVVIGGVPLTLTTMREKDPKIVGVKLAAYVNHVLENHGG